MVKTKKQLVSSRANTYSGVNGRRYITIHETANYSKNAGAQTHANLQTNGFGSTWHWTVDDTQAIQSFPHTVRCWHAGDGHGNGNFNSIGIEVCVNTGSNFNKAVENAAKLTKKIMLAENIPIGNVVQHNNWSGKNCPTNIRKGKNGYTWNKFLSLVSGSSGTTTQSNYLRFGDQGPFVKKLQQELLSIGEKLPKYGADSDFGDETVLAVKSVQRQAGLDMDGIVGDDTRKAINERIKAPPKNKGELTVDQVNKLQKQINELKAMTNPPKSISPNTYHKEAWDWLEAKGLTDGSDPRGELTREQFASLLYRYNETVVNNKLDRRQPDHISDYAEEAVEWAMREGISTGQAPNGYTVRQQVITMLYNYDKRLKEDA